MVHKNIISDDISSQNSGMLKYKKITFACIPFFLIFGHTGHI